ncbi:hypothetical protein [Streptomyces sp.]|uniref:hypothetical protein n=1 Tax=Streptomyces sp. TaxID=1931 RepID=UPI002810D978|nr:hypothetical protein [Streptomyces sp.]
MITPPMLRRPAPRPLGTDPAHAEHGAPVARRGELVMAPRDASFLRSPSIGGDTQLHVAVFTQQYAVGSGMVGIAAACDPVRILLDEGLLFMGPTNSPSLAVVAPAAERCSRRPTGSTTTWSA